MDQWSDSSNNTTHTHNQRDAAYAWAKVAQLSLGLVAFLIGLGLAYDLGGEEIVGWYCIVFAVAALVAGVFYGVQHILKIMSDRDVKMGATFADLLHAHSTSVSGMSKMLTEVMRGANAINAADAKTQQMMVATNAALHTHYGKRIADMQMKSVTGQPYSPDAELAGEDWEGYYALPDNSGVDAQPFTTYKLPEIVAGAVNVQR